MPVKHVSNSSQNHANIFLTNPSNPSTLPPTHPPISQASQNPRTPFEPIQTLFKTHSKPPETTANPQTYCKTHNNVWKTIQNMPLNKHSKIPNPLNIQSKSCDDPSVADQKPPLKRSSKHVPRKPQRVPGMILKSPSVLKRFKTSGLRPQAKTLWAFAFGAIGPTTLHVCVRSTWEPRGAHWRITGANMAHGGVQAWILVCALFLLGVVSIRALGLWWALASLNGMSRKPHSSTLETNFHTFLPGPTGQEKETNVPPCSLQLTTKMCLSPKTGECALKVEICCFQMWKTKLHCQNIDWMLPKVEFSIRQGKIFTQSEDFCWSGKTKLHGQVIDWIRNGKCLLLEVEKTKLPGQIIAWIRNGKCLLPKVAFSIPKWQMFTESDNLLGKLKNGIARPNYSVNTQWKLFAPQNRRCNQQVENVHKKWNGDTTSHFQIIGRMRNGKCLRRKMEFSTKKCSLKVFICCFKVG